MKSFTLATLTASLLAVVQAVDQSDIAFVTALVSDYKSNPKEYINFIQTAQDVPAQVTHLAIKAATYTDDSYTTLLETMDVSSLEAYASTALPWYSRIVSAAEQGEESGSSAATPTSSQSSSSRTTSAPNSSSTLSTSTRASNSEAEASELSESLYDDSTKSTPTGGAVPGSSIHVGAVLGAAALILL